MPYPSSPSVKRTCVIAKIFLALAEKKIKICWYVFFEAFIKHARSCGHVLDNRQKEEQSENLLITSTSLSCDGSYFLEMESRVPYNKL